MALRPARDDAEARGDLAAWVVCWQENIPSCPLGSKRISKPLRVINPAALPALPSCNDHSTSFTSRGPREKPRFSEILALKSLRKGWENETEQWQILIHFRLPKLTPETRTHCARWGLRQSGDGKSLSQSTRPDHSYRSDLLIGETIVSFSRFFQRETSVLAPSQLSSPVRTILQPQKNTTVIMGKVTEPRGRAGRRCQ